MPIFDGDRDPLNIPFPTAGGKAFWENLDKRGGYVLQRNIFTGHCRILDEKNIRVAWGEEGPMRAKLARLAPEPSGIAPKYGDVIGVHRLGGVYDHYGVYESDGCVYEYAAVGQDFGEATVHTTTLKEFIRDSGNCFVLTFPEQYGRPGKLEIPHLTNSGNTQNILGDLSFQTLDLLKQLWKSDSYQLFSPEETIQRARSRLGETKYNLLLNNCEHYAIWCKTNLHESHQVEALLEALEALPGRKYIL